MKLGEGGEAFFVFETSDEIPEILQTSPIVSPATSPHAATQDVASSSSLQEPDFLDITTNGGDKQGVRQNLEPRPAMAEDRRARSEYGIPD